MEIVLNTVALGAASKHAAAEQLLAGYGDRISRFVRFRIENSATEERFFAALERIGGRALRGRGAGENSKGPNAARGSKIPQLLLLDSRGKSFSTEQFAEWLRRERDAGVRQLIFAVGPADGWSEAACERAGMLLSLGPMTLPHSLAAVVLAEQIYRAFTIIENHPYHLGHT